MQNQTHKNETFAMDIFRTPFHKDTSGGLLLQKKKHGLSQQTLV